MDSFFLTSHPAASDFLSCKLVHSNATDEDHGLLAVKLIAIYRVPTN